MNSTSSPRKNIPSSSKMNKWCAFLMTSVCLFSPGLPDPAGESICGTDKRSSNEITVFIQTKKDVSDEWVTTFSSYSEGSPNGNNVTVKRRIIECGEKSIIHVQALIGDPSQFDGRILLFHPKGGKNVVVSQDRRTVYRINPEAAGNFAGILTNRRLNDNELFEVKLDRTVDGHGGNIAIGVSPISPTDIAYPDWMTSDAIMVFDSSVYRNGAVISQGRGYNLYSLKAGQRLGIMKKDNGDIHIFIDGVDKGVAVSGINYPVYGVVEIYGKAAQATIV